MELKEVIVSLNKQIYESENKRKEKLIQIENKRKEEMKQLENK